MFHIFVNRLDASRKRMQDPRDRVVLTSDSSTQVVTVEAETQTDLPEFQARSPRRIETRAAPPPRRPAAPPPAARPRRGRCCKVRRGGGGGR
jgi:hypothetical protein